MCHFVTSVLSKSNGIFPDSNVFQEDKSPGQEIGNCLVSNSSILDSLAHGQVSDDRAVSLLVWGGQKWKDQILNSVELMMTLIGWINKMLNFSHLKLSDSQQSLLWPNLISKPKSDLSSCKWHFAVIEFNKSSEVQENTLGCLWPEETLELTSWADLTCEHQVERLSTRKIVVRLWGLDAYFGNTSIKLFSIVVLTIKLMSLQFLLLLICHFLILGNKLGNGLINKFISSVALSRLGVFDHKVRKLFNVSLFCRVIAK
jgi:hypothetical protein